MTITAAATGPARRRILDPVDRMTESLLSLVMVTLSVVLVLVTMVLGG